MLITFTKSLNTLIFAKRPTIDGLYEAKLIDFVINKDTGNLEALWVKSAQGNCLLNPKDIINWNNQEILIEDPMELIKPEDLPKMRNILENEVAILDAKVYQEAPYIYLGKVKDFIVNTVDAKLLSLHVSSGFWIFGKKIIIKKDQIIKITKDGIFIKSLDLIVKNEKEKKRLTNNIKKSLKKIKKNV